MRLPDFLIIGAMKAGTTTLWRDLECNPHIFTPHHKEPHTLVHEDVRSESGLCTYARLFEPATPEQVCGEASTGYSKRPTYPGIAELAREVIGPDLKVIYLVREPIARVVSHHHHAATNPGEEMPADIDVAIHERPELLDYTRYAWQIEPWLEAFGANQVRILVLEEYAGRRAETIDAVTAFLGATPRPDLVREERVYNRGVGKPVAQKGLVAAFHRSVVYQRLVRPLLPLKTRDFLRYNLLATAPPRPAPPSVETRRFILEQLGPDLETLRTIMKRERLPWDLDLAGDPQTPSSDSESRSPSVPAAT